MSGSARGTSSLATRLLVSFFALGGALPVGIAVLATMRPRLLGIVAPELPGGYPLQSLIAIGIATALGAMTVGAAVAMATRSGQGKSLFFPAQQTISGGIAALVVGLVICVSWTPGDMIVIALLTAMAVALGVLMVLPMRGEDVAIARWGPLIGVGLATAAAACIGRLSLPWVCVAGEELVFAAIGIRMWVVAGRRARRSFADILRGRGPVDPGTVG